MTRMRAELGPPTHELHGAHPDRLMAGFLGTRAIGPANLTNTTLLSWLAYGYRCHPMPHQLEGFKIGSYFDVRYRRLIISMIVASIVGAFLSILLHVSLYHRFQFARWGVGEFNHLRNQILFPKEANLEGINVSYKGLKTQDFFDKVKDAGLELFTWTVNSVPDAKNLIRMGIQGITTDRPAWLRESLE